ncbi:CHY zinc finger protein [Corynebacterium atypicum]|uniref:CHY zinc finger protein n=1 Tax=Corynebacterium atypicum TaxID=191610 RepID=UPI001F244FFB|nr:CHY zinc finger protein [Corynebacterium atypicum]
MSQVKSVFWQAMNKGPEKDPFEVRDHAAARRGICLDAYGRCVHYRTHRDVVLNRCGTCGDYFACHLCHQELCDHPFGRLTIADSSAVMCGACGSVLGYSEYAIRPPGRGDSGRPCCPHCGHEFNPGCARHTHFYWRV